MSAILHTGNIADIIAKTIQDYDLKDEDGQSPTDDLYIIRSSQLDELCLTAAMTINKKTIEFERRVKEEKHARSDD